MFVGSSPRSTMPPTSGTITIWGMISLLLNMPKVQLACRLALDLRRWKMVVVIMKFVPSVYWVLAIISAKGSIYLNTAPLWDGYCYCPYFTNKKIKILSKLFAQGFIVSKWQSWGLSLTTGATESIIGAVAFYFCVRNGWCPASVNQKWRLWLDSHCWI